MPRVHSQELLSLTLRPSNALSTTQYSQQTLFVLFYNIVYLYCFVEMNTDIVEKFCSSEWLLKNKIETMILIRYDFFFFNSV